MCLSSFFYYVPFWVQIKAEEASVVEELLLFGISQNQEFHKFGFLDELKSRKTDVYLGLIYVMIKLFFPPFKCGLNILQNLVFWTS